ncbi:MAG: metal-dependent hydrolase [Hydrogenophaga sp.]|uniref:metal-dependent hydrolase n=1 Tax=Hydrogenophaga sp. TaxID=1904254 RepID=UPI001DEF16C3|nr:metal-dependent hydrolase [Hydrogenophaga sp.]MBX3608810.1 metal-dependent hydrolase [Hydrogenophaga sp.]
MDSLTQIALGSAVAVAAMGRRTAVWKAALWGGVAGTLPDLDAFIDHGDAVLNMVLHRAESHALFFLTLAAPLLAWVVSRIHGEAAVFRRWWLALWLALITHPLLDAMTVYGTQLLRPFTDEAYGVGSVFIIDPAYTLPLLIGVLIALRASPAAGLRANAIGLALSSAYLVWSVVAQQQVTQVARASLQQQGVEVQHLLVTPAPFNTVLWRLVAITPTHYLEGHRSLLDRGDGIEWRAYDRGADLFERHQDDAAHLRRIARFTDGFFSVHERGDRLLVTDLRMGQEPSYIFRFDLGSASERANGAHTATRVGERPAVASAFNWLWRRTLGEPLTPPGVAAR